MVAAPAIHTTNRLTITGTKVASFTHEYWTDADPTHRQCWTPRGALKCACGLYTFQWPR